MPNVNPGRFANPEILSRIEPELLVRWLWPAREYLTRRGLSLPSLERGCPSRSGADGTRGSELDRPIGITRAAEGETPALLSGFDYDRLAKILLEPTPEMPADLLEALYVFRELDHEAAMDALIEESEIDRGLLTSTLRSTATEDGSAPTPLDVVVRAWILDRKMVEALHNRMELGRPRSFQYFSTMAEPVPVFEGPAVEQLAELERRLNLFFEAWHRGKGARVFAYPMAGDWAFLVRHGGPCRREGTLEHDEQPGSVFFRPLRHDVLRYDGVRGEMAVNCCAERERRVLLRIFGSVLFGRPDFFPGTAKYTLAPLVCQGRACLACADVAGIERLNLTEVELQIEEEPRHRDIIKSKDIFKLVESGKLVWPRNLHEIKRATFQVKFWRVPRPRQLTIVPCNRVLYGREEDGPLFEKLMMARGFIQERKGTVGCCNEQLLARI